MARHRLTAGFVLGERYRLDSLIATGGMADVWAADDQVLSRRVAVKVMRPAEGHEDVFEQRFRNEAKNAAGLMHPNIAMVFDYGENDDLMFLVMELVVGDPLSTIVRDSGPMAPHLTRAVMIQAALALAVAHDAGVVHRDVKPSNIILSPEGLVKLTDFGIARAVDAGGLTGPGVVLGTPNYISPEQALGKTATSASDIYALGVVAHELLTGAPPFDKGTPVATAIAHVQEAPPPLPDWLPDDLRTVIELCLRKDPAERPAQARDIAARLGLADAGGGLGLPTPGLA